MFDELISLILAMYFMYFSSFEILPDTNYVFLFYYNYCHAYQLNSFIDFFVEFQRFDWFSYLLINFFCSNKKYHFVYLIFLLDVTLLICLLRDNKIILTRDFLFCLPLIMTCDVKGLTPVFKNRPPYAKPQAI